MQTNIIYNEDCLGKKGMRILPNKSVNLIIADPPYNIGKADWDKIPNYIEWSGRWMLECQRVLKDNGSFYWFHSDMLAISKLMIWLEENTKFVFKQFIIWDKWHNIIEKGNNLQGAFFKIVHNDNFVLLHQRDYLCNEWKKSQLSIKQIKEMMGFTGNQPYNWFAPNNTGNAEWQLPTKERYLKLQTTGYWQKPYEELRLEYENLRYRFNKCTNDTSIWNYHITNRKERVEHPTQKPVNLIENILKHSSNEEDIVLIPFIGSGNDCIACKRLNRHYIGFEISKEYCQIAKTRLEAERTLWDIKDGK